MVIVNMNNATVNQQYVADTINFGNVQNKFDVLSGIDAVAEALRKSEEAGVLSKKASALAQVNIQEATQEAKAAHPDKHRVRSLLATAAEAIKDMH